VTSRSAIETRVLVTDRLAPLRIAGKVLHQVWMPYHWGSVGVVTGESANDLFGVALDPNVLIQESKVASCDVRPGRRPRGPELLEYVQGFRDRAGVTVETGTHVATVGVLREKAHLEEDATAPVPEERSQGTSRAAGDGRASDGTGASLDRDGTSGGTDDGTTEGSR
jgi:formate dehydrogenase major subunit